VLGQLALQRRTSLRVIGGLICAGPTRTTDDIEVADDPVLNVWQGAGLGAETGANCRAGRLRGAACELAAQTSFTFGDTTIGETQQS